MVYERHPRAQGASVRNFGMLWPIGQPLGPLYQLALRSLAIWLEVLQASGLWYKRTGSLHLAYHDDEAQVLREFVSEGTGSERPCELWKADAVTAQFPATVREGLRAGLWSPIEVMVDPRQVIAELPAWLARTYGVKFLYDTPVVADDLPSSEGPGACDARHYVICTGADFRDLAPKAFAESGLAVCKL